MIELLFSYSTKNTILVPVIKICPISIYKNIAILEVGSTTSDWYFIKSNHLAAHISANGFNPTYSEIPSDSFINQIIIDQLTSVEQIIYYGTGTSTSQAQDRVKTFFEPLGRFDLQIHTDMLSAARACCGNSDGIISILGTGSNTSYYDGYALNPILPSMGYIIGDQGSGSYIGRRILQDYFFNKMPDGVNNEFKSKYSVTRAEVLEDLYSAPNQAKYLASFVPFLNEVNDPWKDKLIEKLFLEFINLHLLQTAKTKELPLHFVGSIAFYFKNHLEKVINDLDLKLGKIIKAPGMDLVNFHIKDNE